MTTRARNDSAVNARRMLPMKWAVAILGVVIAYVVLQPRLNQWFGWSLPTVASMVGDDKPLAKKTPKKSEANLTATKDQLDKVGQIKNQEEKFSKKKTNTEPPETDEAASRSSRPSHDNRPTTPSNTATKFKRNSDEDDSDPLYGFLIEVGRGRYESPAGLVYGPGSEEGHRLKHIAKHLEDQPNRPGSHGVFRGDMKAFLIAIDDTYTRAKNEAKGTTKKDDDGSVVYEVTFEKTIGFIGGEAGEKKKNPAAKKMRLVVRGSNVITAFPF